MPPLLKEAHYVELLAVGWCLQASNKLPVSDIGTHMRWSCVRSKRCRKWHQPAAAGAESMGHGPSCAHGATTCAPVATSSSRRSSLNALMLSCSRAPVGSVQKTAASDEAESLGDPNVPGDPADDFVGGSARGSSECSAVRLVEPVWENATSAGTLLL
jgi:hypothetical protein